MQRFAFLLFLSSFSLVLAQSSQITTSNYTQTQVNNTIANATAYVNSVNMSAYLIFSPNLTQAYAYLNKANNYSKTSPGSAILYAALAKQSAQMAYSQISAYKKISFAGMVIFTIVAGLILYVYMRPIRRRLHK